MEPSLLEAAGHRRSPATMPGYRSRGAVLVRRGKGGRRREVGVDRWAWNQLDAWLEIRAGLPVGCLLCVINGPTAGRHWEASAARKQLHHAAMRQASEAGPANAAGRPTGAHPLISVMKEGSLSLVAK